MSKKIIISLNPWSIDKCCGGYDEDSLNLLIYDNLLKIKEEPCLKKALRLCDRGYGVSYEDIREFFIENNYLKHDYTRDTWIKYGMSLTLDEIKKIASDHDLKNYGRKEDVLIRIYENVDVNTIDSDYFLLSDEGLKFIEEHEYIKIYKLFLFDRFYFSKYEKYFLENGQNLDAMLGYFKMHEDIAFRENNDARLANSLGAYSQICAYYDKKEGLYEALYEYCLRINNKKLQVYGVLIDYDNIKAIKKLSKFYSDDEFENVFKQAFKNIKVYKIPKYKTFESLKDILNGKNDFDVEKDLLTYYNKR